MSLFTKLKSVRRPGFDANHGEQNDHQNRGKREEEERGKECESAPLLRGLRSHCEAAGIGILLVKR